VGVNTVIMRIYGGIRYERVNHDMPVLLNSRVCIAEAVKIWMDSLREAGRIARMSRELDAWRGSRKDR